MRLKSLFFICCLFLFTGSGTLLASNFSMADNFRLIDHQGVSHSLSYYSDYDVVAIFGFTSQCDKKTFFLKKIKKLRKDFKGKRIKFFFINPIAGETRELVAKQLSGNSLDMPVLMDPTQMITKSLGLKAVGDYVLLNAKNMNILKVIKTPPSKQCQLNFKENNNITYIKDVIPILKNQCLICHKRLESLKMFSSYENVKGWSQMIRYVIRTGRMPPGGRDIYYGKYMRSHTDNEMKTLLQWIDQGMPRGKGVDSIASFIKKTNYRQPDLVFQMKVAHKIPATGILNYKYV